MKDAPESSRRFTLLPETPRTVLSAGEKALVTTGAPLVGRAARRLHRAYPDLASVDELVSEGNAGLLAAARSYDAERGPFAPHAFRYIVSRMRKAIRRQIKERQRTYPIDADTPNGFALDGALERTSSVRSGAVAGTIASLIGRPCRRSSAGESTVVEADLRAALQQAIDEASVALPAAKGRLAALYYKENHTLEQAAAVLGIGYATAKRYNREIAAWIRERLCGDVTPVPLSNTGT